MKGYTYNKLIFLTDGSTQSLKKTRKRKASKGKKGILSIYTFAF